MIAAFVALDDYQLARIKQVSKEKMVKDVDDFNPDSSDDSGKEDTEIAKKLADIEAKEKLSMSVRRKNYSPQGKVKDNNADASGTNPGVARIESRLSKLWRVEHDMELLDLWGTKSLIRKCDLTAGTAKIA